MSVSLIELINPDLLQPEDRDTRYDTSPFVHIKAMGPKQKGKYYELIAENVLSQLGYIVQKPQNTDHDRLIDGVKTEIKGGTLNKGTNVFSFLQIRPDQDYQDLMFVMCYPCELVIMSMNKEKVDYLVANGVFKRQHGGNKGSSGTYCYYGNKETLESLGATHIGKKAHLTK